MALGFTQNVTEMSTGRFLGVKRGRSVKLTSLPPSVSRLPTAPVSNDAWWV
jgi:hypothetical protein